MSKRSANQWFRLAHKWAGLLAAAWLIVLGATGFVLDHPDWRPSNQLTVPESWGSPDLTRFIRVTYMRQVLVDPNDSSRWYGGSERGLWSSADGGESWIPVDFRSRDYSPQVYAIIEHPDIGFDRALVATDEGLWQFETARQVRPLLMTDVAINSLSRGRGANEIIGVAGHSRVFSYDVASQQIYWAPMQPIEPVISGEVPLTRYILNTHFGHGIAEGALGILINDLAGVAMVILGVTGFLYWFLRRRWRLRPAAASSAKKRRMTKLLFRSHAPFVGLLAAVPIFYVSLTGIPADHIRAIYKWAESVSVPAALVPAGFSMRSLAGDIQDIVINPADGKELIIATRKGLYHSSDGGGRWVRRDNLPIRKADYGNSLHLFRIDDTIFVGAGLDANFASADGGASWLPVTGPFTGISSGARSGDTWYLKNSQGVFAGIDLRDELPQTAVRPPPLEGMPLFLFLADIHTGHAIHPLFPWVNDLVALLALVLVCTGPVVWWRRKWI